MTNEQSLDIPSFRAHGYLLLGRTLAARGQWEEAQSILQEGLAGLPADSRSLSRLRALCVLVRVQIVAGLREAAATTQVRVDDELVALSDAFADPGRQRRWRVYLEEVETRIGGAAALTAGQVCVRLPRRNASHQWVAVVRTTDGGAEDEAILASRGKVALRWQRLRRLQAEAAKQGAVVRDADLANALGVSMRTLQRDLAALEEEADDFSQVAAVNER